MNNKKHEIMKSIISIIICVLLGAISIVLIIKQPPRHTPEYFEEIRSIME